MQRDHAFEGEFALAFEDKEFPRWFTEATGRHHRDGVADHIGAVDRQSEIRVAEGIRWRDREVGQLRRERREGVHSPVSVGERVACGVVVGVAGIDLVRCGAQYLADPVPRQLGDGREEQRTNTCCDGGRGRSPTKVAGIATNVCGGKRGSTASAGCREVKLLAQLAVGGFFAGIRACADRNGAGIGDKSVEVAGVDWMSVSSGPEHNGAETVPSKSDRVVDGGCHHGGNGGFDACSVGRAPGVVDHVGPVGRGEIEGLSFRFIAGSEHTQRHDRAAGTGADNTHTVGRCAGQTGHGGAVAGPASARVTVSVDEVPARDDRLGQIGVVEVDTAVHDGDDDLGIAQLEVEGVNGANIVARRPPVLAGVIKVPLVYEFRVVRDVSFASLLDPVDLCPASGWVPVEEHRGPNGIDGSAGGEVKTPLIGGRSTAFQALPSQLGDQVSEEGLLCRILQLEEDPRSRGTPRSRAILPQSIERGGKKNSGKGGQISGLLFCRRKECAGSARASEHVAFGVEAGSSRCP